MTMTTRQATTMRRSPHPVVTARRVTAPATTASSTNARVGDLDPPVGGGGGPSGDGGGSRW